jgi:hypothetical protein
MKRFLIPFIVLIVFALSSCVSTVEYKKLEDKVAKLEKDVKMAGLERVGTSFRPYSGGLGTGANALGKTTGTVDKDAAVVITNDETTWGNAAFFYSLDADGGGTQSVPYVIDSGDGGDEDWELVDVYGRSVYGLTPFKEITSSCTFGSNCDGALVRLVWGGIILSSADDTTITLPEIVASAPTATQVVPGASICVINQDTNENFLLDCYTDDHFVDEAGAANGNGQYIGTTAGASSLGDFICVVAINATTWQVVGYRGTIVKE